MPNILKTLKGPLSTFKKNRNGRIYSKELWENVLNSEYWHDMIENNSLCGEIVHPGERTESDSFEIDARNVSHRIKEAHIEGDKLIGTVEILDTEQGHNLLNLVNSGCTIGISARGMGDLIGDVVNPDTYNFKTFDITFRPSDPNARLVPLEESEKIKLKLSESDISDSLLEASVEKPSWTDTSDVIKNTIIKRLYDELISRETDIRFTKSPAGIKFTREPITGNFFVSKATTDEGEQEKYAVFTNRDKSFGYFYIPIVEDRPNISYKDLADKVLDSINGITQNEQLSLDLDNKEEN